MKKEKCDCGAQAVWCYSPGYSKGDNPYSCDDCVHRGCTCNWENVVNTDLNVSNLPTDEDKPWKWIITDKDSHYGEIIEGEIWVRLDDKGREYPCVEYDYEPDGFDDEIDTDNEDEHDR